MLLFGIMGCLWNILIFRHHSFRYSSYCTYMFIGSITSLIHISFSLTDRIIDKGLKIDWTVNSIVWCKIRHYIAHCTALITLSCLAASAIDQFFSTCCQIKWRSLSSIHTTRQICIYFIIFWMLITIPNLIYVKPVEFASNKRLCQYTSLIWSQLINYFFHLCCYGILPWILMSLFGCLTFRKMHQIRNRRIGIVPSIVLSRMAHMDDQLSSILFFTNHCLYSIINSF
ncbi:unnamed protein product [Rotaria magnacalcarata]